MVSNVFKPMVLSGPQGCGKSKLIRQATIKAPGLYLVALPTRDLIDEQVAAYEHDADWLEVARVYSGSNQGSTAERLTEKRREMEERGVDHCVIFTTHETLMAHHLDGFEDYHVRVDEAPTAVQAGQFKIGSLQPWLKETFDHVGGPEYEWSAVRLKTAAPNWKAIQQDTGASGLAEFIKTAKQPNRVFVKARSWDEGADIRWFSMWTSGSPAVKCGQ